MAFMKQGLEADSFQNSYRSQRIRLFNGMVTSILARKERCDVLDVGGTHAYWAAFGQDIDWSRVRITLLNLKHTGVPPSSQIEQVIGDATNMHRYGDNSFDIVHSNSVIEHVGLWTSMEAMAREIRRVAPSYFVQTPSFWFPIEAHSRFPFFHYLPEPLRVWLIMQRKLGYWDKAVDVSAATHTAHSALLLHKRQMLHLFPEAEIVVEKAYGFPKSYIAMAASASPQADRADGRLKQSTSATWKGRTTNLSFSAARSIKRRILAFGRPAYRIKHHVGFPQEARP